MELKNLKQVQKLFPDAIKLQLRINKSMTKRDIRGLLPNSVVVLSCGISKNYANIIYSEGAAKRLFPDATMICKQFDFGNGLEANLYDCKKGSMLKLLINFIPNSKKTLIDCLQQAFGDNLIRISSYEEVNMGCIFLSNVSVEDCVKILTLYKEDGKDKEA